MVYITVRQSPSYHQMTLEELYAQFTGPTLISANTTATHTYVRDQVSARFPRVYVQGLIDKLRQFNLRHDDLRAVPRQSLYTFFRIPKKSGFGWRQISKPNDNLMAALRELKTLFEQDFHALTTYHTTAYAYIRHRCVVDVLKRHQQNESRWFAKLDLHDFFGSTTLEFVMQQFSMVFPFNEVVEIPAGRQELERALELAFLNGGLPQGTPLSPLITNIMMLPVDFWLAKKFRSFDKERMVYTRYADDFLISSQYAFSLRDVGKLVMDTLAEFHAPFSLNQEKSRYASSAGSNWNLGLMLNKDNEITVGYKKKRQFKSMLVNFLGAKASGAPIDREDVYHTLGLYSYYHMVEPAVIDAMVSSINEKFHTDVLGLLKAEQAL